jgi:hypothetical protein
VTDANGCTDVDSMLLVVDPCLGILQTALGNEFFVYPNPSRGELIIEASSAIHDEIKILITDVLGKETMLIDNQWVNGSYRKVADISSLGSGTFFLHIKTNKYTRTIKLIKE